MTSIVGTSRKEEASIILSYKAKMRSYTERLPTKYISYCAQRFGITALLVIIVFVHYISSHAVHDQYEERTLYDEYEDTYLDEGLRFHSNSEPLIVDHREQPLTSDHPFFGTKDEPDGLHFVSSHPTNPAPSLDDNWLDSADRPYFPKGQDKYFSFNIHEEKIEEMATSLPKILDNYKNPCWFEEVPNEFTYNSSFFYRYYRAGFGQLPHGDWVVTFKNMENRIQYRKRQSRDGKGWRLRCYPYYFVLGFTKAGTTDYCRILHLFPSVFSGIKKEPQYWNKIRSVQTLFPTEHKPTRPTLADYLDLYDAAAEGIRHKTTMLDGQPFHTGIIGDCDPQTVWQLFGWEAMAGNDDHTQPTYKTPSHLYALYPKTKFIVLLRDPVERAFSHYRFFQAMEKDINTQINDFHSNVNRTIRLLEECTKLKTTKQCIHDRTLVPKSIHTSITVGLYSIHIREWLNVFPREQFLFLKSEDYFDSREQAIKDTIEFLGLDLEGKDLSSIEDFSIINVNTVKTNMRPDTLRLLKNFFKSYNQDLVNLLQDDRFNWGY
ncbi:hypothetical protein LSH36_437g02102 [Paralvinella palmiformis]|uniref:Sulfotransferase domain-containing protein n=1 Tax=Paralvinella palmiformis TaxID=53620 RepID=A0AAD9MXT2_9ANNE|nr:hypothetical protein LSH36_437g02102 [Paralvinella palmiformis]